MISEAEIAVGFLLENLGLLLHHGSFDHHHTISPQSFCLPWTCKSPLTKPLTHSAIQSLHTDLTSIKYFLESRRKQPTTHEDLKIQSLVSNIKDVVCEVLEAAENENSFSNNSCSVNLGEMIETNLREFHKLESCIERIRCVKKEAAALISSDCGGNFSGYLPRSTSARIRDAEFVVGFDEEEKDILGQLVGEQKQMETICIVGMAGIGKTTLAKKLFNHPFVVYHFYVRAWTSVSQVCRKGRVLSKILSSTFNEDEDAFVDANDEKMGERLYKHLKGKRYLIVVDDIWDARDWNDMKMYFPNDCNGSRVLMTTRLKDVVSNVRPCGSRHFLALLKQQPSWALFERKVFGHQKCPPELVQIGMEIVAKCKGLPLAIVVVAGLLAKKERTREWWNYVAQNIGSCIKGDAYQFMDILALSYDHLPHRLKLCFLYLSAFPKDFEIPTTRLIHSWIAEGFVQMPHDEENSLEEVAESYLVELVNRSLVSVAKERLDGGIKACSVHDMLRDLCSIKAREKRLKQLLHPYERPTDLNFHLLNLVNHSMCFHSHAYHYISSNSSNPCAPRVRISSYSKHTRSFVYTLLRVLDLRYVELYDFPTEIMLLIHLRYLALWVWSVNSVPTSISNLWNLETLVLHRGRDWRVLLPASIWEMQNLRHLYIQKTEFDDPDRFFPDSIILHNLQSIKNLCFSSCSRGVLSRIPNLRKLGLNNAGPGQHPFPDLSGFRSLAALKILGARFAGAHAGIVVSPDKLPASLKKLTLSGGCVSWGKMEDIGLMLPHLEVLKVEGDAATGGTVWETSGGGFVRLKFLKLCDLYLEDWIISSSGDFPSLQRVVVSQCPYLREIPAVLGDIPTLQKMEVFYSPLAAVSAREIQEFQQSNGNDELKVLIHPNEGADTT